MLLLALQCCSGDMQQALNLAALIGEIEPKTRGDVEFAILHNRSVKGWMAEAIVAATEGKFVKTHIIKSKRFGIGWPDGCNDLWQDGMMQIAELYAKGTISSHAVLTFEPDCLMLRPDWINALIAEWNLVSSNGKHCFGHIHDAGGTIGNHINGNAVFRTDMVKRYAKMQTSATAWDCEHKDITLSVGVDSDLILQQYGRRTEINREEILTIRKNGKVPAFVHGIKHQSGIEAVREMIKDGSFHSNGHSKFPKDSGSRQEVSELPISGCVK